jgi:hypothetical protein
MSGTSVRKASRISRAVAVVAGREWIVSASRRLNTTVSLPELADVAEVRVAGRKMIVLEIGLRLIAPYDVPLWVRIEGIHLGTRVVGKACGLRRMTESLRGRAEEKPSWTAMNNECNDRDEGEDGDVRQQAQAPSNHFRRAQSLRPRCICLRSLR